MPEESFRNSVGDYEVINTQPSLIRQIGQRFLFMTALANLEWSRGYLWYVELDDVPAPFQRGGVLGLPVTDITYNLSHGKDYTWNGGIEQFSVPIGKELCTVNLTMYDDEKATIFTFFERWYNNIYNSRAGVLPVVEAAKCISIYKLKASRNHLYRYAYRYDMRDVGKISLQKVPSRELLVYPKGPLVEQEKIDSQPRTYNIELVIVNHENPDYGDPAKHEGISLTGNEKVDGFLSKASNYF